MILHVISNYSGLWKLRADTEFVIASCKDEPTMWLSAMRKINEEAK